VTIPEHVAVGREAPLRSPGSTLRVIPDALVEAVIGIDEAIELVEAAFAADAAGAHVSFPVVRERLLSPFAGIFGVKSGLASGTGILGLKAGGFWAANRARDLAPHQSTVLLFDPATGRPVALLGANALTGLRTGAAGAVAARHLARPDADRAGLIGCGVQGRMQLRALARVRRLRTVRLWDRNPHAAASLAGELAGALDGEILLEATPAAVVAASDIVVTATPGAQVVIEERWTRPGLHVTAVGADTAGKQELDPRLVARATLVVDNRAQAATLGEAQHLPPGAAVPAELGEVVAGLRPGRTRPDEVTVFDATGVTFQDLVVAEAVRRRCEEEERGVLVDL